MALDTYDLPQEYDLKIFANAGNVFRSIYRDGNILTPKFKDPTHEKVCRRVNGFVEFDVSDIDTFWVVGERFATPRVCEMLAYQSVLGWPNQR